MLFLSRRHRRRRRRRRRRVSVANCCERVNVAVGVAFAMLKFHLASGL